MAIVSHDFKIQWANTMLCTVLGYTKKELEGRTFSEITHPDDIDRNVKLAQKLYNGQIPNYKIEKRYIRKDGETIWAKLAATVIRDEEGDILYGLGIVENISKEKLLEKQLIATEKLRTVGEISATISHEFRNSLTSIRMLLELLQESGNLEVAEKKSLLVVLKSVNHLENIATQLLKFSKPAPAEFLMENLNKIIEESLYFINSHIAERKIKLKKSLDNSLEPMPLDVENLKEALVNIILNSIGAITAKKASIEKREISISTKKHYLRSSLRDFTFPDIDSQNDIEPEMLNKLELELPGRTACAVIEINDTGEGIDPKHIKKIFDPFFSTKKGGTGLGLSMVKRIVNSHGGIINVASEVGKGTKFCIYLPLQKKE